MSVKQGFYLVRLREGERLLIAERKRDHWFIPGPNIVFREEPFYVQEAANAPSVHS